MSEQGGGGGGAQLYPKTTYDRGEAIKIFVVGVKTDIREAAIFTPGP